MSIFHSSGFKYLKNFIIGIGAAVVMIGALGKINSEPWGGKMITWGLGTEAFLFAMLGILGPEKDYYWQKLYPGLDKYNAEITPLALGEGAPAGIDGDVMQGTMGSMLEELQTMSKSMSSLKALQEVDFSQTSGQMKQMSNFYERMNEAMVALDASVEDTKKYKEQMGALNKNLSSLNGVYGNVLSAFGKS